MTVAREPAGAAEPTRLEGRLRLAAVLVVLGLAVEAISFAALHPAGFFAFLAPGALLVAAGIALYLWSIASDRG